MLCPKNINKENVLEFNTITKTPVLWGQVLTHISACSTRKKGYLEQTKSQQKDKSNISCTFFPADIGHKRLCSVETQPSVGIRCASILSYGGRPHIARKHGRL